MLGKVEWTPYSFIVENKEIIIILEIVDQLNRYIFF